MKHHIFWLLLFVLAIALPLASLQAQDEDNAEEDVLQETEKQKEAVKSCKGYQGDNMRDFMVIMKGLEDYAPRTGEDSPDFRLSDETGENEVVLSQASKDKPVVLVFGSYT